MPQNLKRSVAIFCKVVDNYGDIGICWRLARQFAHEHDLLVNLWVDDLVSFKRICPKVNPNARLQTVQGIAIHHWNNQERTFDADEIDDIVIEFFGVDIPPNYILAMSKITPRPVWINLEGLTAEEWVEGCHTLPSSHPQLPLTKHFFFPGFTAKTGGLLCENQLLEQRHAFLNDAPKKRNFLNQLGLNDPEQAAFKVSLFCYPQSPLSALLESWVTSDTQITCIVPEGVARDAIASFTGAEPQAGTSTKVGSLTLKVSPFIPQTDYDKLLWACDFNFVRGEDSIVRAQWAGKPFVWHIYPQDENLHHVKLKAFLNRFCPEITELSNFTLAWNDALPNAKPVGERWNALISDTNKVQQRTEAWQQQMRSNGDLVSNLLSFASKLQQG
jgi:uncharacterized repeat protein (TIGR03837 family)